MLAPAAYFCSPRCAVATCYLTRSSPAAAGSELTWSRAEGPASGDDPADRRYVHRGCPTRTAAMAWPMQDRLGTVHASRAMLDPMLHLCSAVACAGSASISCAPCCCRTAIPSSCRAAGVVARVRPAGGSDDIDRRAALERHRAAALIDVRLRIGAAVWSPKTASATDSIAPSRPRPARRRTATPRRAIAIAWTSPPALCAAAAGRTLNGACRPSDLPNSKSRRRPRAGAGEAPPAS